MGVLTFANIPGVSMVNPDFSDLWDGDIISATSTQIVAGVLPADQNDVYTFTGVGFTTNSQGVTGGTLTGVALDVAGANFFTLTGLSLPAIETDAVIQTQDGNAFVDFLLQGADSVVGTDYDDTLRAAAGDDTIVSASGDDVVRGEGGNDFLFTGFGRDRADGGDGNDFIRTGPDNDTLIGGAGNDTLGASNRTDLLKGGDGDDLMLGSNGNDRLFGEADNDTLLGGNGRDTIDGGDGADRVVGGGGNDRMFGRDGDDTMLGNSGNDYFGFVSGETGNDTIADFAAGAGSEDVIILAGFGAAFDDFADVQAAASQVGGDTVLDLGGGNSITLTGVTASALHADDFIFV